MRFTRSLSLIIIVFVMVGIGVIASAQGNRRGDPAPDTQQVHLPKPATGPLEMTRRAETQGSIQVIVVMETETPTRLPFDQMSQDIRRQLIDSLQGQILSAPGLENATHITRYENFPLLALEVDADGLAALLDSPMVRSVTENGLRAPNLAESTLQIGAAGTGGAWELGYTGQDQTVAILDSGVEVDHSFLTDTVVEEACFSSVNNEFNGVPVCPDGVTEATGPGSAAPCTATNCDHGTHLAGIAAGTGQSYNGVAPDASIIAIQVYTQFDHPICGSIRPCIFAADADIIKGMDYVYSMREEYNIAAVNLSFGGGQYFTEETCAADPTNTPFIPVVSLLREAGIATIAAAGNDGWVDSMDAPACLPDVISVGSVGFQGANEDTISLFTNAATFLDFLSPGYLISSSLPNDQFGERTGTSQATSHVVGAYALVRSAYPDVSLDDILDALTQTGVDVIDTATGNFYKRIQVNDAIQYLIVPGTAQLVQPEPDVEFNDLGIVFEWEPTENTDSYLISVKDESGAEVAGVTVNHADCTEVCTTTLNQPLTDRDVHTWTIISSNAFRESVSQERSFYVDYPGAPTTLGPVDLIEYNAPSQIGPFEWTLVPAATEYRLFVNDMSNGERVVRAILTPQTVCTGETCTYTLSTQEQNVFKDNRVYQWRVQARSDLGKSNSERRVFATEFPAAPFVTGPDDSIVINSPSQFTRITWQPVFDVDEFKIIVKDTSNGKKIIKSKVDATLVCSDTTCAYDVTEADRAELKDNRTYKWFVQSRNDLGKTKSEKRIIITEFPGQPALTFPYNGLLVSAPSQLTRLQWTDVLDVEEYKIQITERGSGVRAVNMTVTDGVEIACTDGICAYDLNTADHAALKGRRVYDWTVQARNSLGKSRSDGRYFETNFPAQPILNSPPHNITFNDPSELLTFSWQPVTSVQDFRLIVKDAKAGGKKIDVDLTVGENLTCDSQLCTYNVTETDRAQLKDNRDYLWLVEARINDDTSRSFNWRFTAAFPGAPQLIAPADDTILTSAAQFTAAEWTEMAFATQYEFKLTDKTRSKTITKTTLLSTDPALTCGNGTCTYTIPSSLQSELKNGRKYQWLVIASNSLGAHKSDKRSFHTDF